MVIPIILCGGAGTRLWPLSRPGLPKPFLPLLENQSLFEQTLQRAAAFAPPVIACHAMHLQLVQRQCQMENVAPRAILLEPEPMGTAAALAAACLHLKSTFDDAVLLILPADIVIKDQAAFEAAVSTALPYAEQGKFVTFGIRPTHPEPRYGYIETGTFLQKNVYAMQRFTEKPSAQIAAAWSASQKYFWNSGMFLLPLRGLLEILQAQQSALLTACSDALRLAQIEKEKIWLHGSSFTSAPRVNFEKAVMEHIDQGVMIDGGFDWNDAGTWNSLWELHQKDINQNVSQGDVRVEESHGCYIHATSKRVSVLGCDDLVVVETADEVLVIARREAEKAGLFSAR
jgi:mannose-1-phosphate guanylyltransferase/mannose-6-phosphate isomerase